MSVVWQARVSQWGSDPEAVLLGAFFGTEGHKSHRDTLRGGLQTDGGEQEVQEEARPSTATVEQLLGTRKKGLIRQF